MHSKCFALISYHESDVRCCLVIYALDRFRLRDLYDPLKLICYVRTRMRACFINDVGMRSRVKSVRAWISMRSSIQPRHIRSSRYNTLSLHNTLFSGAQASLYQMRQKQTSLRSMCFCEVVRLHTKNKYNRSILCVCLIFWLHFYLLLLLVFFFHCGNVAFKIFWIALQMRLAVYSSIVSANIEQTDWAHDYKFCKSDWCKVCYFKLLTKLVYVNVKIRIRKK